VNGETHGLDSSPGLLAKAEVLMKDVRIGNVQLQVGDAYDLPCESDVFDLGINKVMLDLVPEEDIPVLLVEFERVLKPGGRIV
jgi:ubiquinone/menaquinone biosynthesis C-methylase UbiE